MRAESRAVAAFVNEGDVWALSFDDRVVRLKDAKGLRYLATLLRASGREVHVLDLVQPDSDAARAMKRSSGGEALDDEARTRYKQRLIDLEAEIEEADDVGDATRAEQARAERDAILAELSAAYGLGGRRRRSATDPTERARKAVTERVRTTLTNIERAHPALGRHLRSSIRTGAFCSYAPEQPVAWDVGERGDERSADSAGSAIRVIVVDDHPLWRHTLRSVLEHTDEVTVVAEVANGADAIAVTLREEPDVVLMDIELGDITGIEATANVIQRGTRSKVLVLSSRDERKTVVDAIRSGADGYLLKTADAEEIIDAVRRAHAGEAVFPDAVAKVILTELRERPGRVAR